MTSTTPSDIITFWTDAGWDRWYTRDDAFDAEIRARFLPVYEDARDGKLAAWENTDDGTLALILLLDQFPRNLFRDDPRAFATDAVCCALARRAIARGVGDRVDPVMRQFVYMPLMHSEDMADQEHCCALFRATGETDNLKFADIHADIIRRFGRFPHRNAVLGRDTTAEEQAFLDAGGFKG
ncbi:DUF924 domain-containing protein [Tardiphaga alba]|uniref:DUF924 domain-containing protein n=1 Tax=Tardiphaga alba TaxID=340268 RepID=A0ABX8AFU2_9BRAD|nr:DUF924 family protein [Tardiphaga alba]QUS41786.1 DUF924 domain-containing protein [Tardiphaga alba]